MQQNRGKWFKKRRMRGSGMMVFQLLFVSASFAGKGAECSVALGAFGLKWSGNVVRRVGCVCVSWKKGESIY